MATEPDPLHIDYRTAHASRVYDYLLGGQHNFEADRAAAHAMAAQLPPSVGLAGIQSNCRVNRIFLGQAVRWLTSDQGVRQFLDIGPGIPTVNQTHVVAQQIAPEARIVYVDNDPIVIAQAHELLRGNPQGDTAFHQGDLRHPEPIIEQAKQTLDFSEPIGLMLVAIYHMIADTEDPWAIHATLLDALPSGSWVVLTHLTSDFVGPFWDDAVRTLSNATREPFSNRGLDQVARFLDGLDIVPPGVAPIDEWLRDGPAPPAADVVPQLPEGLDPTWVNPLWAAIGKNP